MGSRAVALREDPAGKGEREGDDVKADAKTVVLLQPVDDVEVAETGDIYGRG